MQPPIGMKLEKFKEHEEGALICTAKTRNVGLPFYESVILQTDSPEFIFLSLIFLSFFVDEFNSTKFANGLNTRKIHPCRILLF